MQLAKAIYVDGKIVTGRHHGEAFSFLSEAEKNSNTLLSGFWDPQSGRFISDCGEFYTKRIFLIRHSNPACGYDQDIDPPLCEEGVERAWATAHFLNSQNLEEYEGFTSPFRRCLETAHIIAALTGLAFVVDPCLVEPMLETTFVENHAEDFPSFRWETNRSFRFYNEDPNSYAHRISERGRSFPKKSVAISHCSFIADMAELLSGNDGLAQRRVALAPASLTYIDNNEVVHYGKQCQRKEANVESPGR
jgi:phosphohistidine phosphatase SixA